MTLDQTRARLEIAQHARLINYAAADINEFDKFTMQRRFLDIADLAEQLAEDARKLAADIMCEMENSND
jgi:hypothetical protein